MITISDIAEQAKVSRGTVDRVIHERGGVSRENIDRVKKAMIELNYRPNIFARGLSLSKTFVFGVLMPDLAYDIKYWQLPKAGVDRAQELLAGFKVKIKYYHFDITNDASFDRVCGDVIRECDQLDGLLLSGSNAEPTAEFLKKIPPQLPYVLFDTTIPDAKPLSFIGTDSFKSGVLGARLIHMLMEAPGEIAIIKLQPDNFEINNRVAGFVSFFEELPDYLLNIYDADRSADKYIFTHTTKRILEEKSDIKAIFVPSSAVHEVAEAAQFQSSRRKIYIIGYDLTDENAYYLKEGTIDFLINRRPKMQSYRGIDTLYSHVVKREPVESQLLIPFDIVARENIDYYLADFRW